MEQFEVLHALTLRETRTRFGHHKLGYLWALVEPAIMILTFYILFQLAHKPPPPGMTLFAFVATGICPYLLFSNALNRVADAISGNQSLLYYPQVNPLDLVIARTFLEFATYVGVFLVLMMIEMLYMQEFAIADPLLVVASFALATFLGATAGLVFLALGQLSKVADRARGPLLRPFFWISGIFFTAESLPPEARGGMLINPVLHVIELSRAGWFERYDNRYGDSLFVLKWCMAFLLVGLFFERSIRRKIELT